MHSLKSVTSLFAFLLTLFLLPHGQSAAVHPTPDIRFILQTQAGLTAYAELPEPISLLHARQLLADVEVETDSFVYGEYVLAGQPYHLKLAIGADGWIVAFHPTDYASQHLLDCAIPFNLEQIIGRPERAIQETAVALGYPNPVIGFYDGRFPQATQITLHWLYIHRTGNQSSTLTLPLENLYLERGYVFCTALTNSQFFLNGQRLEQAGAVSQVIRRWQPLNAEQLRAGQTNQLQIDALSLFGTGFLAGVSVVYTGDVTLPATGGYTRTLNLSYPVILGNPLVIHQIYLPLIER